MMLHKDENRRKDFIQIEEFLKTLPNERKVIFQNVPEVINCDSSLDNSLELITNSSQKVYQNYQNREEKPLKSTQNSDYDQEAVSNKFGGFLKKEFPYSKNSE